MTMTQDDLDFMDSMSFASDMNRPMGDYNATLKETKELAFAVGERLANNKAEVVRSEALSLIDETGLQGYSSFNDDDFAEVKQQIIYGYLYGHDERR